jgi:predicted nucleic acid-binding protein
VIAYFDTSALVPLLIEEPTTPLCTRLWNEASRVVSARLWYPEARSALARAQRLARLSPEQLASAVIELDRIAAQVDHVEITAVLSLHAGQLAQAHALRGYDAVHLASALAVADRDVIFVTGDAALAAASRSAGLAVSFSGR